MIVEGMAFFAEQDGRDLGEVSLARRPLDGDELADNDGD
jgi:hypothetical protein